MSQEQGWHFQQDGTQKMEATPSAVTVCGHPATRQKLHTSELQAVLDVALINRVVVEKPLRAVVGGLEGQPGVLAGVEGVCAHRQQVAQLLLRELLRRNVPGRRHLVEIWPKTTRVTKPTNTASSVDNDVLSEA